LVEDGAGGEELFGRGAGFGSKRRDVAEFGVPFVEEVEVFFEFLEDSEGFVVVVCCFMLKCDESLQ